MEEGNTVCTLLYKWNSMERRGRRGKMSLLADYVGNKHVILVVILLRRRDASCVSSLLHREGQYKVHTTTATAITTGIPLELQEMNPVELISLA